MPKSYSVTDIGQRRKMNQDFVFASDEPVGPLPCLYIVADGMGGHKAGELASRFSVEHMADYIRKSGEKDPRTLLDMAMHNTNRALRVIAANDRTQYQGMGTTVVAATVIGNTLYVANVGDSRLYLLEEEMRQITVDHSLVEEMVLAGSLDEKVARTHPDRNIITRAIGAEDYLDIDFFTKELHAGSLVLMCTDGLTNMVEDADIRAVLKKEGSFSARAAELVSSANAKGGRDNISVIVIDPLGK